MSDDYVPDPDDEFDPFARIKFGPYFNTNFAALGFTAAENTALQTALSNWGYSWTAFTNAEAAFNAAMPDKDAKRAVAEGLLRKYSMRMQTNTAVTDSQRAALGITVRKTSKTPSAVPTTVPVLDRADTSTRCILRLFYSDQTTPDSTAKPPGVQACEIREQIGGTAPTDPNAMAFGGMQTRAPFRANFDAPDAGKHVWFAFRWMNTRGQFGPWSQIYEAMIPG